MDTAHKKHTKEKAEESKQEPVVIADVVTETTKSIEVIEEVVPQVQKSEPPVESAPTEDPLLDFKEKMKEEDFPMPDQTAKKNFMWPIIFVFIIALVALGGIFVYKNKMTGEKINVVSLSPTPTIAVIPTIAVDLSKYTIKILNGSGVAGEASRQKTNLEAQGFTIDSVGNADNSDHTDTIIQAKKSVDPAFVDKLKGLLSTVFTVGDTKVLSEDAATPVVVILGTKK